MHKNILIISDIEGSSGCLDYESSAFKTEKWADACVEMSLDVNSVVEALFNSGADKVIVKDFHRTGYNLLPDLIDSRAKLVLGYKRGPVPGLGDPEDSTALMMLGMHAASGSNGFLAHTMTSRIEKLEVNGSLMSEVQLFSSSLEPFNISPVFFSGCPTACLQAEEAIENITSYPIDKLSDDTSFRREAWREGLADASSESLKNVKTRPYKINGPFEGVITMRDGEPAAMKLAGRWNLPYSGNRIFVKTDDIHEFYYTLIRICYLSPFIEKILPAGLIIYNLMGKYGQHWVKRRVKKHS